MYPKTCLSCVLGVLLLVGCSGSHSNATEVKASSTESVSSQSAAVDPQVIAAYTQCRYNEDIPRVDVVREIDLATVLTPAFGQPLPEAPKLAPGRSGIWFFLGQRPTPGYGVALDHDLTRLEKGHLTLGIHETKPDPARRYAQMLTSPCALISINDISFIKLTIEGDVRGLPVGIALE